jgi:hypothetical protein
MTATAIAASETVDVYNLDPAETPGGMKVRWRVRTVTGKDAEQLEKLQNQAIISLLTWADSYLRETQETAAQPNNKNEEPRETTGSGP